MRTAHVIPEIDTPPRHRDLPVITVKYVAYDHTVILVCEEVPLTSGDGLTAAGQRILERIRENGLWNPASPQPGQHFMSLATSSHKPIQLTITLAQDAKWDDPGIMERVRNAYCGFPGDAVLVPLGQS